MRRSFFRSMSVAVLAASVPVLILAAQAKPNVKLGLWESITTMEGGQPGTPQKICITAEKLATGGIRTVNEATLLVTEPAEFVITTV